MTRLFVACDLYADWQRIVLSVIAPDASVHGIEESKRMTERYRESFTYGLPNVNEKEEA